MRNLPVWIGALLAAAILATSTSAAELKVSDHESSGAVAVVEAAATASVYVDANDVQPAGIAAGLLADDVHRVTGRKPKVVHDPSELVGDAIVLGTIGHSALVDKLIAEKKVDVGGVRGQWETFQLQVVEQPTANVRRALVIVGSDRRGTAYGALEVSRCIGVSPWYFWADVPVVHKDAIYVEPQTLKVGPPTVKYRGIFLNDEAPSLTGWVKKNFGDYNHQFYTHVFELLLRLRGNYLWPAMWNNCFNEDDPQNPKTANEWGIVMGTSHVEPMMRADKEWNRAGYTAGQWNYDKFPKELREFWKAGIERNKPYENLITIAMRGKIDTPMSETANIALLERIVADQRKLIGEVIDPDVAKVPQLWCLYKEVQEYYEKGMRVPDDVTLLWSDDNWGDLRRLPTADERKRSGGAGVYYHFDYVGDPRNYKWLNTVPITKVWEQMHLAWRYGADRVWIVNVGDLKPMEFPLSFFMDMAWDPSQFRPDNLRQWGERWAARQFGPAHAAEIADIIAKYTKYNGRRKPELIDPSTFSVVDYDEADRVNREWAEVELKAQEVESAMPAEAQDAYYQIVLYPVMASANVTRMYTAAAENRLYASQGRALANEVADGVRRLFQWDADFADRYNHKMAHGKWDHMMDQTHIGYTSWQQPDKQVMPTVREVELPEAATLGVSPQGTTRWWPSPVGEAPVLPAFDAYNRQRRWIDVFNRGGAGFDFTAKASTPWIVLDEPGGRVQTPPEPQRVWVSVDWDKAPAGKAEGEVTVSGAGGSVSVKVTALKPREPARSFPGFVEADGYVSIEAEHYTRKVDAGDVRWQVIPDYGRTLSSVTTFPVTAASGEPGAKGPFLEYRLYAFDAGKVDVEAILAPTLNFVPGRGLRYAVSFDDQAPVVVDMAPRYPQKEWQKSVADSVREMHTSLTIDKPGEHTLKFWRVDPGVVLQKLVIDFGGVRPSYLGPPESYRGVPAE